MVNNKTAVVADLQAALDCSPSLNTAGVSISKQLGISMSDHVEVYIAQMINNKTAVVALIQAALDGAPSLNTAGVNISEQLGIPMSDQVELLYSSRKRRGDKEGCSGCSHTSHLELCTKPEQGWRLRKQTMHYRSQR